MDHSEARPVFPGACAPPEVATTLLTVHTRAPNHATVSADRLSIQLPKALLGIVIVESTLGAYYIVESSLGSRQLGTVRSRRALSLSPALPIC